MLGLILQVNLLCVFSITLVFVWRRVRSPLRHLDGPPNFSFLKGNLGQIYSRNGWKFHRDIVEKYGGAVRLHGLFGRDQVYLSDPKALYHVLVKDSLIYDETTWYLEGNKLVFGQGLLSTIGDHHKRQRKMLNPVFSIKHMRNLTPIFQSVIKKVRDAVACQIKDGSREIDMLNWMSRGALEIIGQGGLGYSIDPLSLDKDTTTLYGQSIKNLIPTAFRLSMFRFFIPIIVKFGPAKLRRFVLDYTPSEPLQTVKEIVDVMDQTSSDIFRQKKAALQKGDEAVLRQVGEGKDIMSILLNANTSASVEDRLPEDELIAQMSTFMFAGHDTTSSAMSRMLHTLAVHPDAQDKLRREIIESGILRDEVSYDELMALPYLDAVCRETLRLHPPINFMTRTARKDMVLPLGKPVKASDGVTSIHELFIAKGTDIITAFGATNRLTSIWGADAHEWKPERWLEPLPESVAEMRIPGVCSSLMTFSAGPRSCIGFKFAELEIKMLLMVLLQSFSFDLPDGKEIIWNLGGIQTPAIKGAEAQTPHMPLKISFYPQS